MIVGMWNKSVILTYFGMAAAVGGIWAAISGVGLKYAFVCLIIAGVADLFDGAVARRVKRTEDEKAFGVQLDSLVDVLSFIALPIAIFTAFGMTKIYHAVIFVLFAVCGIARLGYFNVVTADTQKAVKYYTGLPVTYCALVFPVIYLLSCVMTDNAASVCFSAAFAVISVLEVLKIPVVKPKGAAYAFFALLAILLLAVYAVVL